MDMLIAACAGIALAAACGFRVFVPLLVMGIAAHSGKIDPAPGFEWVGSWPAMICFGAATAAEIGAYYVPWIDNALDTITTPGSIIAGTIATAAMLPDIHPAIKWTAAIVGGGGAAGAVQLTTVLTRGLSSASTGGIGNPAVSTGEAAGATALSIVAVLIPLLAAVLVIILLVFVIRRLVRWARRRPQAQAAATDSTPPC
jgi:hypothetical protein